MITRVRVRKVCAWCVEAEAGQEHPAVPISHGLCDRCLRDLAALQGWTPGEPSLPRRAESIPTDKGFIEF
jgi:hypothetical protein